MQKWLPDAFTDEPSNMAAVVHGDDQAFESENSSLANLPDDSDNQATGNRLFMSESGFSGPETIMIHLTQSERAQVFELIEQDIVRDFETREKKLREDLAMELEQAKDTFQKSLESFSENLHQAVVVNLKETSDMSAKLALHLAEKIIRSKVETDPNILIQALETTLFKIDGSKGIILHVNPDQVGLFEDQSLLQERFGIEQVVADRRVDLGGCIVKTDKMEWDATIKSQLQYLEQLIEEMIATADAPDLLGKAEVPDESSMV